MARSKTSRSKKPSETSPLLRHVECIPIPESPNDETKELSSTHLFAILSSTWLGIFLAALDGTMVATLTASISASYNSLSLLAWLASSYFIATSVLQPLSGKLTDIYGRRAGLIFSNLFFLLGNLICGLAPNERVVIFGRIVAGLGGGGLNAIPLFITSDLVPLRQRGVWQGFNNICFGLGSGLGGVFGGWMNDALSWRWAFLSLVPLTLISGLMITFLVKLPEMDAPKKNGKYKRVDFLGSLTLTTTIVLLLVGLNSGGNTVPWTHPLVLTTLPLSLLTLTIFIYIELRIAPEPIIPLDLFLNRTVTAGCLTNWFMTMSQIALTFYAPIYFQLQGLSALGAGLRLIPTSVGAAFGSLIVGYIMRLTGKYLLLNVAVQLSFLAPLVSTTRFNLWTPDWQPLTGFFFSGFSYAGMLTITVTALIAAVEHEHHAVVTSASYAFRGTGSTIGISICSLVFQNVLRRGLWEAFRDRHDGMRIADRLRTSLDEIKLLPPDLAFDAKEAYMQALHAVFCTLLALASFGAIASFFMRQHTLYSDLVRQRA